MALLRSLMQVAEPAPNMKNSSTSLWRIAYDNGEQHSFSTDSDIMSVSFEIHVVHFDHEQRGEESTMDRDFVKEMASDFFLPFHWFLSPHDVIDNTFYFFEQKTGIIDYSVFKLKTHL